MQSEVRLANFLIIKNSKILKNNMASEARQKKMEKFDRVQKCSILRPQNLGSAPLPRHGSAPVVFILNLQIVLLNLLTY